MTVINVENLGGPYKAAFLELQKSYDDQDLIEVYKMLREISQGGDEQLCWDYYSGKFGSIRKEVYQVLIRYDLDILFETPYTKSY